MVEDEKEELTEEEIEMKILQEEAEKLKKKHGVKNIFRITVYGDLPDEKDEYHCWIKQPGIKEFSAFTSLVQQGDVVGASRVVINSCFVAGDEEFKTDEQVFLASVGQLESIMETKRSAIAKF